MLSTPQSELSDVMPGSVRVYLMKDFGEKASVRERAQVSKQFVADSLRNYLLINDREIPEDSINELVYCYGAHGKPFLADPLLSGCFFSLSHTKEIAICAVAGTEIGCDVEQPDSRRMDAERAVKIARRYFAPDEYEMVLSNPEKFFFPIWTKKEAYVKWTGRGFTEGFSTFSVNELPDHVVCEHLKVAGAEDAECAICYTREV